MRSSSQTDEEASLRSWLYLSPLLEKFVPFLPEDMRESYTMYQLQQKLEKHFGDAIVVQCR
jgi:hypothetical protein